MGKYLQDLSTESGACLFLFIHNVNMNNLPVSSFLSAENHYCTWQAKGLGIFFFFVASFHLAPLHCIDSRQLLSGSSRSLLRKQPVTSQAGSAGCHALRLD